VASIYELTADDQVALWATVAQARQRLMDKLNPDGVNVGLNDGVAAGQTVMHAHIHLIPRYEGDVADPRGGVRWLFPGRARNW
jgi:diadenosine tetraphosphate (Ap4A) HIT family hydrolase